MLSLFLLGRFHWSGFEKMSFSLYLLLWNMVRKMEPQHIMEVNLFLKIKYKLLFAVRNFLDFFMKLLSVVRCVSLYNVSLPYPPEKTAKSFKFSKKFRRNSKEMHLFVVKQNKWTNCSPETFMHVHEFLFQHTRYLIVWWLWNRGIVWLIVEFDSILQVHRETILIYLWTNYFWKNEFK